MATEEALGRPLSGNPDDRLVALNKRLDYLNEQIQGLLDGISQDARRVDEIQPALSKLHNDLAAARAQLEDWRTQQKGRN